MRSMTVEPFETLAAAPDAPLDELALALAAEFRSVDHELALRRLDALAAAVAPGAIGAASELEALVAVLGGPDGFAGDRLAYDAPSSSMLDLVLERRRGLPILLSIVYVEVARRAGIALAGVGLPGHFVCGHVGGPELVLIDPFHGGRRILEGAGEEPGVRPWTAHETAVRMLNNLVALYSLRGDVGRAIRGAELRLMLPAGADEEKRHERALFNLQARLN